MMSLSAIPRTPSSAFAQHQLVAPGAPRRHGGKTSLRHGDKDFSSIKQPHFGIFTKSSSSPSSSYSKSHSQLLPPISLQASTTHRCRFVPSGDMNPHACGCRCDSTDDLFVHILTAHGADPSLHTDISSMEGYGVSRDRYKKLCRRLGIRV
ncbi:hypothetical protein EXIGLDRAFT_299314 [Exidia glandulosa HHB12029]|uniref:Uncharacterized protein n=1 Tax=Exidia glandulosa HHB12029 TaxID=1314781 RepID=A0A165DAB5_EXIGL|nr:hypothetical protein EXIGLDRAFT_299314 [Exidia glandulosa HHB12029]